MRPSRNGCRGPLGIAIDIAIRYRYRSCPAFPIASSDIDSEPWKEHESVCGSPRYTTIRRFLVFFARFSCSHFIRYWFAIDIAIRYRYRSCPAFPIASSDIDSDSDPERTTTPVAPWLRWVPRGSLLSLVAVRRAMNSVDISLLPQVENAPKASWYILR
uniref:Uncharacterized protein n=1 Tax=Candidatus Kentrum sp. FM TaxID=2126340 RepID=A0A450S3T5_9GAMM|nr:MAG: hypothetical protein BECKFM1743A_GA0114220_100362 [Candidatus Kentron sp. FM]